MSVLEAHALTYRAEGRPLVENANFRLQPGELTMLIGAYNMLTRFLKALNVDPEPTSGAGA